ncbi:hypothetical protein PanWU01x14_200900 [Parasponia andersonii]|uniref:Uncharacterized protein n=1 Tax=Parasponia andersonii TaxID=3476 RepID=A0A2P5BXY2_PARAD|nr:hypothetical protein PanWU01x14_200900 [Parasponia andersonii]
MSDPLTTVVVNLNSKDGGNGDEVLKSKNIRSYGPDLEPNASKPCCTPILSSPSSKVVLDIPKISSGPEIATQWKESVDQPLIKSMHGSQPLFDE